MKGKLKIKRHELLTMKGMKLMKRGESRTKQQQPRTMKGVKTFEKGAQTNGQNPPTMKNMKAWSESTASIFPL